MDRFSEPPRYDSPGGPIWVKVTAENGMWGLGYTDSGSVTSVLIKESLMPVITDHWSGGGSHRSVQ